MAALSRHQDLTCSWGPHTHIPCAWELHVLGGLTLTRILYTNTHPGAGAGTNPPPEGGGVQGTGLRSVAMAGQGLEQDSVFGADGKGGSGSQD